MTKKQQEKIRRLSNDFDKSNRNHKKELKEITFDRDDWKKRFMKLQKIIKSNKIKICNFCGNPVNKKPESKKEKNKRVMDGINELKRKGIFK